MIDFAPTAKARGGKGPRTRAERRRKQLEDQNALAVTRPRKRDHDARSLTEDE